jgi:methionyl-tRNA formyltransferase
MGTKIAVAGVGQLCIDLISKLSEHNFEISHLIVSCKSSPAQQKIMNDLAQKLGLTVYNDFTNLTDEKIVFTPNYQQLIPENVFDNYNFINVHFALLPRFRGYHPVQAGLINGDKYFGYSVHQIDDGIDSGPVYFQHKIETTNEDTILTITQRLSAHLCDNIGSYFEQIVDGHEPAFQNDAEALYACIRRPEDSQINWKWDSDNIVGLVKALPPPNYPGAYSFIKNKKLIVAKASLFECERYRQIPGQILCIKDGKLLVKTNDTAIWIERVYDEEKGCEVLPTEFNKFVVGQRFI